jgi:hypothetical protein
MRNRGLLFITIALLLSWNANSIALEPKDIQEWPRAAAEEALPSANPSDYYVYASRLLHEGDHEGAAFWYYVGEIRYRFYLAANPKLSESGAPALFGSLHESVGSMVSDWTRANPEAASNQLQRALDWDASKDNTTTSKSEHAKEWNAVRAEVTQSERAVSTRGSLSAELTRQSGSEIASGLDVNGPGGDAALYRAMARASKEEVARLLKQGANPNMVVRRDGTSAVSVAAMQEDPWFIREVLTHGGDANFRNPLSKNTPLFDAILARSNDNARILISAGADMNTLNHLGVTPMFVAAATQRYDLVYDMLKAGADPTIKVGKTDKTILSVIRHSRVPPGAPPYEWQLKVIDLLKQKGIDVEHSD